MARTIIAPAAGQPWELGKNFEKSAVCTEIIPVAELGVLETSALNLSVNG